MISTLNYMSGILILMIINYTIVRARTVLSIRSKFGEKNIKKLKKGVINYLFFVKFQKMRNIGIWYNINIIYIICLFILLMFVLLEFNLMGNLAHLIIFTIVFIFMESIVLVADIKTTEKTSKLKGESLKNAHISSFLYCIIGIGLIIYAIFHVMVKIAINLL